METKYAAKSLFFKAVYSSMVGLPVSMVLNQVLISWIKDTVNNHEAWLAALILSAPFVVASVTRMFVIDLCYERFGVNISPEYHIRKLINGARSKLNHAGTTKNIR